MRIVEIQDISEANEALRKIGVDPYGIAAMAPKMRQLNILLEKQSCKVANILKQEMLSLGADAAVARGSVACAVEATDVLLIGTQKQIRALAGKIEKQPVGLAAAARELTALLERICTPGLVWKTARRAIDLEEKTLIMGVLNVTPDSFSDGNRYLDRKKQSNGACGWRKKARISSTSAENRRGRGPSRSQPVSKSPESRRLWRPWRRS